MTSGGPKVTPAVKRLLGRKSTIAEAMQMTKGKVDVSNMIRLGDGLTKEDLRHMTASYEKRVAAKGQKMPKAPREMTPLEVAYRAQSSRIFKAAPYEQPGLTYKQMMMMFPNKSMAMDNPGFKTSEFQPTQQATALPPSQTSVNDVRAAHMAAGRNAGQMGFPVTANTYAMDTTYTSMNAPNVNYRPSPARMRFGETAFMSPGEQSTLRTTLRKRGPQKPLHGLYAMVSPGQNIFKRRRI